MTKDMSQNRSVWHMETKAGPLLHGGGLQVIRCGCDQLYNRSFGRAIVSRFGKY